MNSKELNDYIDEKILDKKAKDLINIYIKDISKYINTHNKKNTIILRHIRNMIIELNRLVS